MRTALCFSLSLLVFTALAVSETQAVGANKGGLATVTGSVLDNKGNPLAGALVSLLREGSKQSPKEAVTDRDGKFLAKVLPGRYGIKAIAIGFNEVSFSSVNVKASQEVVYRFNLEPIGYGNTLPERRRDREDVKWTLRSAQSQRSIFQVQEGENADIPTVTESGPVETPAAADAQAFNEGSRLRPQGVVETYYASSAKAAPYVGLNFAISAPLSEGVELIVAGQTGNGDAPERLEASTRFRVGERHKVGLLGAGMLLGTPVWLTS
jgi:hypothetical protein